MPFPLVIQLGKWRRMVTIPAVTKCTSQALTAQQTRLPTRQNEGANNVDNIPLIAISTGQVDGLECVLEKLGIDSSGATNQCAQVNAQCGPVADGCGALVECGSCAPGETCGYKNIPKFCGKDAPK